MPKRLKPIDIELSGKKTTRVVRKAKTGAIASKPAADLDPLAKKEWRRILTALERAGMVTADLDASVLRVYCMNVARVRQAEAKLAELGTVYEIPIMNTHQEQVGTKLTRNPWLAVLQSCERAMLKAAAELGLSPASRNKQGVQATPPDPVGDALDEAQRLLKEYR